MSINSLSRISGIERKNICRRIGKIEDRRDEAGFDALLAQLGQRYLELTQNYTTDIERPDAKALQALMAEQIKRDLALFDDCLNLKEDDMRKRTYTPPKIVLMRDGGEGAVLFLSRNPKTLERRDFEAAQSFITTEAAWEACHHLYDRGCGDWVVVAACTEEKALRAYNRADFWGVA